MNSITFHIALILALVTTCTGQESQVYICGNSSNGFRASAVFGILSGATYCEDTALGEFNDSGPPPGPWEPAFRWINPDATYPAEGGPCFGNGRVPGPLGATADYRPYTDRFQSDTFKIYFQPDGVGSGFPFLVSWTDDLIDHFDSVRLDYAGDSGSVFVDMDSVPGHSITDATVSTFRIITWGAFGTIPPPMPPALGTPPEHDADLPLTVQLSWIPARKAIAYEVQVSADSLFSALVHHDTTTCQTSRTGTLRMSTRYYWHVRTLAVLDQSEWSAVRTFTTSIPGMIGSGTATIDGVVDSIEYASGAMKDIIVNLPGGATVPGRLYVMNDGENLYFAVRYLHVDGCAMVRLSVEFFQNLENASEGDDYVSLRSGVFLPTEFNDYYRTGADPCPEGSLCGFPDTSLGGTCDGQGALTTSPCGCDMYEISHPLRSSDAGFDFQLRPGDPQGFRMGLRIFVGSHYADTDVHDEFVVSQGRLAIEVGPRWNLLSLPLAGDGHCRSAVFPTAESQAYAYDPAGAKYAVRDSLCHGRGFWLKFPAARRIGLFGEGISEETLAVEAGWNLIGSVNAPVGVSSIASDPPELETSEFFGYNTGYYAASTIEPGRAYWVNVSAPGALILSAGATPGAANRVRIRNRGEQPPPPPDGGSQAAGLPAQFRLDQNYPNPFNPATSIRFELPRGTFVTLRVFNVTGTEVGTLVSGRMDAGPHVVRWDAAGMPSGVYYLQLRAGSDLGVRKMLLMK